MENLTHLIVGFFLGIICTLIMINFGITRLELQRRQKNKQLPKLPIVNQYQEDTNETPTYYH